MLIAGALVFNYVVTIENIPVTVQHFVAGFHLSPIGFLLLVNVILLVLGCLLEGQHDPAGDRADLHPDREGARHRHSCISASSSSSTS